MDPRSLLYDRRIIRRNLEKGQVSVEEHEQYLKDLKDLKEECEVIDPALDGAAEGEETPEGEEHDAPAEEPVEQNPQIGVLDE